MKEMAQRQTDSGTAFWHMVGHYSHDPLSLVWLQAHYIQVLEHTHDPPCKVSCMALQLEFTPW